MLSHISEIRVRYGETDKMGVVYYGTYPLYLEVARTDLMRKHGIVYRNLEENGIQMPVVHLECTYFKPAFYDDVITINTIVKEIIGSRIIFEYELYNKDNQLLNKANTTLIFVNSNTGKPCRPPLNIFEKFKENI
jgi:acyl-CoA thioester hydrolase